jgi:type IV pilus assembly protein PilY1
MYSSHYLSPSRLLVAAGIAAVLSVQIVAAQPSQKPLLSRDGGGVKPNIMLTMDDSGSMMFQHMPEENIILGSQTITSPVGSASVRMDPGDNATLGGPGSAQGSASQFRGTISGDPASSNFRQKLMRSPDTNTIYYNPEVRYQPWPLAVGGRMAIVSISAAPRDPMNQVSGGTIDLTNIRSARGDSLAWCFRPTGDASSCVANNTNLDYDPGLYYRLRKNGSRQYLDGTSESNYDKFTINATSGTTYTKYPARTDCTGTTCTRNQERQNFANWFTYYRTRNLLARGAVAEAFSESTDTFRLGYGRINKGSTSVDNVNTRVIEAGVRDFTSTRKSALFDYLYALPANGGTPLRLAMQEVGNYYSRADSRGPWSEVPGLVNVTADKTCRRSYHLLVTDGYWNDTVGSGGLVAVGNEDNTDGLTISGTGQYKYTATRPYTDGSSNTLADYAMKYWKNDLRPATVAPASSGLDNKVVASLENPAFWQHMVNFTVGLGVRGPLDPSTDLPFLTAGTKSWGSDKIDDLWHAAVNSRGEYFSAKDPNELAQAIRTSIGQTLQRELREAGVATAATTLQDGNRKYVPLYNTGAWNGDIQAFALDANGQAGVQLWNAESKVPAWATRKIFTWDTGLTTPAAVPFTWAGISTANRTALGAAGVTYGSTLVDFLRGDRSNEGTESLFRRRNGVLGDFINSTPALVKGSVNLGYSTLPTIGTTYSAFLTQKAARTAVLFTGGNDGMVHGFKDTFGAVPADDGKEVFAFVPRTVYPNLGVLADKTYGTTLLYHQYFVDGPVVETDAYIRAPGANSASWRNYLLGSLGSGGRAIYALDVTDTANLGASTVRWEISSSSDSDLGYVYGRIEAGVLPNGEWVAIFGNGQMSTDGKAVLFVANLETGALQKLVVESAGSNGLAGVAVQRNSAGQITNLYAGDLKGKLWKFNYNAAAAGRFEVAGGTPFFSATSTGGVTQPITQAPAIFAHPDGGSMLVFGTGILTTEADANSTAVQAIYGVWDKPSDAGFSRPITRDSLSTRTMASRAGPGGSVFYDVTGTAVDFVTQRGWVIDLTVISGLRVVVRTQRVSDDLALVSTLAPAQNVVACDASSGIGITFVLPVNNGANPTYRIFDTNGDGAVNSNDASSVAYQTNNPGGERVFLPGSGTGGSSGGFCPAGFTMGAFLDPTTGRPACIPNKPVAAQAMKDRVWRRIINPPIR